MIQAFLLSIALFSQAAFAGLGCEIEELSGTANFTFEKVFDEKNKPQYTVTSQLLIDGEEVPALRSTCFFKNVPGERGFLCAHKGENTLRYDVYPVFNRLENDGTFEGVLNKVKVIRWSEDNDPTGFGNDNCN